MIKAIVLPLLFFVAASSYAVTNSYVLPRDMGWGGPRAPGGSLDGYWYLNDHGWEGCFQDSFVYKIEGDEFYQVYEDLKMDAPMKAIDRGGEFYIQIESVPGLIGRYHVQDLGQELKLKKFESIKNGVTTVKQQNRPFMKTCDNPTITAVLLSLANRVFDADRPITKVTKEEMEKLGTAAN